MIPFTDWCRHRALFFDDLGHYVGCCNLKYSEPTFGFKGRLYNFLPERSSFFKFRTLFSTRKFYFYTVRDPMPLVLDSKSAPIVDSKAYKHIMQTDLIKKLNDLQKNDFFSWLFQPKIIIPLIIGIAVLWYILQGGKIL